MNPPKGIMANAGLQVKISGIASVFVLLAIVVLAVMGIFTMRALSLGTAVIMGNKALHGDISFMEYVINDRHGSLALANGTLVDEHGNSLNDTHAIVDMLAEGAGVAATIFVRQGNEFRRISTSFVDAAGNRMVDTFLAEESPALRPILEGREFLGRVEILGEEYLAVYRPVFSENGRNVIGIFFIGLEMSTIMETIAYQIRVQAIAMLIIAAVILLLSVILVTLSCRYMLVRPIARAVEMLREISEGEGDLTHELTVSGNDEIGKMAHYFNMTLERIKKLVISIRLQAVSLSGIGSELSANMAETASAVNEITSNIRSIKGRALSQSASVTETNATMEQVTENINKLNGFVEKQSSAVDRSSAAIEQMIANVQSVTNTLSKNAHNVKDLEEASEVGRAGLLEVAADIQGIARESESLLEINQVMQNIASQTNLLSMNAAIEAAHAGASGRGFAVVADEIRKLAESSSSQSKTISSVLKKIKSSIDKITGSTDNVLKKFEAIDAGVKTVVEQESIILNAMEEQGHGSKQVLHSIGEVNEITHQVKDGSLQMFEGSREVIGESKNLEKVTQEITGSMNEMAVGADQITVAINRVNNLTEKNQDNINSLVAEVSKFKVE